MLLCVPPGPTQYIFHTPVAQYSLYVLKVPLNTKQTNKQTASPINLHTVWSSVSELQTFLIVVIWCLVDLFESFSGYEKVMKSHEI